MQLENPPLHSGLLYFFHLPIEMGEGCVFFVPRHSDDIQRGEHTLAKARSFPWETLLQFPLNVTPKRYQGTVTN